MSFHILLPFHITINWFPSLLTTLPNVSGKTISADRRKKLGRPTRPQSPFLLFFLGPIGLPNQLDLFSANYRLYFFVFRCFFVFFFISFLFSVNWQSSPTLPRTKNTGGHSPLPKQVVQTTRNKRVNYYPITTKNKKRCSSSSKKKINMKFSLVFFYDPEDFTKNPSAIGVALFATSIPSQPHDSSNKVQKLRTTTRIKTPELEIGTVQIAISLNRHNIR